jgi:hypothetical protein
MFFLLPQRENQADLVSPYDHEASYVQSSSRNAMNLDAILNKLRRGASPDAATVRALVADPQSRAAMLARPDVLDALARLAARRSGVGCAIVDHDLGALIDAEQGGEDVQRLYGAVRTHIEQCPDCTERYMLARQVIARQHADPLLRWPVSPLPSPMPLVVPRSELRRALAMHARPMTLRGASEQQYLVYDDAMPGRSGMFAQVMLASITDDRWSVVVMLLGNGVVPNLTVWLRCDGETLRTLTNNEGEARFDDIPPHWLAGSADLLVGLGET